MAQRKVRYAVIGGGEISQGAFMPGISQSDNSELAALVTGNPTKAETLSAHYGIPTYHYDDYPALLQSGDIDAVYIATPNFMHREHAMPALEAGVHVLLEKPMATSVDDCQAMIGAAANSRAKLMVAYRLHHEPGTLEIIDHLRQGRIGDVRSFSSHFGQAMSESNHRAKHGYWGGPVPDMGNYPLNAVRHMFGQEPISVTAVGSRTPGRSYNFDDSVSVVLGFPEGRQAQFHVSYAATPHNHLSVLGTNGAIFCRPCYVFGPDVSIDYELTNAGETTYHEPGAVEQFGGQTDYFSQCILDDVEPEADGTDGLRDVRVLEAIERALATGQAQTLEPLAYRERITNDQVRRLTPVERPEIVGVNTISGD
ncbi:Gfo/Idh/MocA family oxidoreductase [Salinisphaera sp. SPP-AMP-43]|uniref:Gfo/Idh/MocA family protein n=1 Tax=Salinisphaera sp. SPP-AMP-43 TaxID=3121288 RepID=UPI003C6E991D